jgi:hypothetical protein
MAAAKFCGLVFTAHPSAEWIARQLTEAHGWQRAPRYVIRDRDCVYGEVFLRRLRAMAYGITRLWPIRFKWEGPSAVALCKCNPPL